jgi:DNA-binding GntR family transcriptional regulator
LKTTWAQVANFQPQRRIALVAEVADHLRRRIVSGELAFGWRLPSITTKARLDGVSPATMHAAVHIVASLGLLRIRHGVGVFVERPRSAAAQLNHAWMHASPAELGLLRAAIDANAPPEMDALGGRLG